MFYAIHNKKQNSKIMRKFVIRKTVSELSRNRFCYLYLMIKNAVKAHQ